MENTKKLLYLALFGLFLGGCQGSVQVGGAVDDDERGAGGGDGDQSVVAGVLQAPLGCNHGRIRLGEGTYTGTLVVGGNHCVVEGVGPGKTIIDGPLELSGNHNVVRALTVSGPSKISGNHNNASGVEFRGTVDVSGNHNRNLTLLLGLERPVGPQQ